MGPGGVVLLGCGSPAGKPWPAKGFGLNGVGIAFGPIVVVEPVSSAQW
jgi:hypothetical protein